MKSIPSRRQLCIAIKSSLEYMGILTKLDNAEQSISNKQGGDKPLHSKAFGTWIKNNALTIDKSAYRTERETGIWETAKAGHSIWQTLRHHRRSKAILFYCNGDSELCLAVP
jgi:hypothetical protein